MLAKRAKVLTKTDLRRLCHFVSKGNAPVRNRAMVLLSAKAGLRAGEIAKLTWAMVCDNRGRVGETIDLLDSAAKKRSGRTIPIHPDLRQALIKLRQLNAGDGPVIRSDRGEHMRPTSVVNWFAVAYRTLGLAGCSSHSGRRTFITNAARSVHGAGGSLRDVQLLAGHQSIEMTQRYIEGDERAQRRLVRFV